MFNVCIKHMNKVLNCYKTYEVKKIEIKYICLMCELNIYLCFRMLQSQKVKEYKKSSSFCSHIL